MDPAERAGQQARIRFYDWLARNAPALNAVPLTVMRWSLASPARRERSLRRELAATPEAKQAGLRIEFEAVADALRQGTRGAVQELALRRPPWPFPLSEIKTPVHLWHGARDTNAPIAIARRLARTGGRFPARQRLVGPRCRPRPQRRDHVRDRFLREIERSGSPWCRWSC